MKKQPGLKVAALAGGVGGARLADGLRQILPPGDLTVIVNTGDDFEHLGLWISPDLDTVCYTLAGLANPETGWGRADETWSAIEAAATLGGPDWFRPGRFAGVRGRLQASGQGAAVDRAADAADQQAGHAGVGRRHAVSRQPSFSRGVG